MKKHTKWFDTCTQGDSVNAAATKAGVSQRTLARQYDRGDISAEIAINIARAYGRSPVEALIELGYISKAEARGGITLTEWDKVSDAELLRELLSRTDDQGLLSRPLDAETVKGVSEANVTMLHAAKKTYPPSKETE